MTARTTFATAAAEGGTSASSSPIATNTPGAEGNRLPGASIDGIRTPQSAAVDGRVGDTPSPTRHPAIFPLLPRFTYLVAEEPTTFEVCVTIDAGRISIYARDVLAAAGLDLSDYADEPACPPFSAHAGATAWSFDFVADLLVVIDDQPQPAAFLRWLEQRLHELHQVGVHRFESTAHPRGYDVDEQGDLVKIPEVFSVRAAARILDRDPVIAIGQGRLFELLHTLGWIHRAGGVWRPAPGVPARGLLAVQDVAERHYSRHEPYPQVIVTVAGLRELHQHLGGTAALDLTPHPTLNIEE
ncbi:phage antirepressor KilAC domain-containing protein [Agromyces sp. NPDC058136]|uniref:phage antirepressor KilAC domain-containing protein n=1 Tax=Agromyces sp. NPDC058136 TaxID=3346354 RepID=UPI0036DAF3A6